MELYAHEIHQAMLGLESIPGALVLHAPATTESQYSHYSNHHPAANWSTYRRGLRKLDRTLQVLEAALTQSSHEALVQNTSSDNANTRQEAIHARTCDNPKEFDSMDSSQLSSELQNVPPSGDGSQPSQSLTQSAPDEYTNEVQDSSLPEQLVLDLRLIVTQLAIVVQPQADLAGVGELAVTILDRASAVLAIHEEYSGDHFPLSDVIAILHRLLDDDTLTITSENDVLWASRSIWLRVLNAHFLRTAHQRAVDTGPMSEGGPLEGENQPGVGEAMDVGDFFVPQLFAFTQEMQDVEDVDSSSPSLPGWVVIQYLPQLLELAIEMVQSMSWEPTNVGSLATETCIQWRILTGYMIEHAIHIQQEDHVALQSKSSSAVNGLEHWVTDCFREAEPTQSDQDHRHRSRRLLSNLRLYAMELAEYALDALDGASVLFSSSKAKPTRDWGSFLSNDSVATNDLGIDTQAVEDASIVVQDSLRHVALATNVLESIEPWYNHCPESDARCTQSHDSLIYRLWKTAAESFISKSDETTVFTIDPDQALEKQNLHENKLASLLCYHHLRLADLFLASISRSHTSMNSDHEFTLTMTLLRALDFPEQLLEAPRLWNVLEQRVTATDDSNDLKKLLQVAVLTLRKQYNHFSGMAAPTHHRKNVQAVVDRLVSFVTPTGDPNRNAPMNPFDSLFLRQLGNASAGRMME